MKKLFGIVAMVVLSAGAVEYYVDSAAERMKGGCA